MSCVNTPVNKAKTGIQGFDEITGGGLPAGRTTLVCGGPGCGKTLFAMEFLVRGATEFNEPGIFMAFEESMPELCANVASVGFDLQSLLVEKRLLVDEVELDPETPAVTGDFDLDGLFLRLADAIDRIGARRLVLDTLERLFGNLPNPNIVRRELHRLFRWLKEREVTVILTAERGDGTLTRHGLEEYVSDCVIVLSHELEHLVSTRRLRVLKYRGSGHGTNEYPFLIDDEGISILPVTSVSLAHEASQERISSGVERLDDMLGGQGFFRGSSILISGTAGTGKTSLAGHFANATCKRDERALYFAFEESPSQIVRNLCSIGLDLSPWIEQDRLRIVATRPSFAGLEMHLALMHRQITDFKPQTVLLDPLNSFLESHETQQLIEVKAMLMRMLDFIKLQGITGFFTSLTGGGEVSERTDVAISSLIDTWIALTAVDANGERNRRLGIIKSRGMAHSTQTREFQLTNSGIQLIDPYLGIDGRLTGSARVAEEERARRAARERERGLVQQREELELQRTLMETRINTLRTEFQLLDLRTQGTLDTENTALHDAGHMANTARQGATSTGEPE
ncbi:Circadian clock protein kinase KaiC [Thiorhodovibrio winogradskyi]|uniref:non-specific serine/threonine protein kinase n=1 Tax=Thiorhodovibrio winogradskyi TaxID=77007 RepID=A0ABZ0S5V7_9GAMM|nr:circadian clock protein KaiC [Thiorhodovibrio winogradskyi]